MTRSGFAALILSTIELELAGRRRMRDGVEHLKALVRQLRIEELGESGAEGEILVHDHHRLGRLAGLVVDGDEIFQGGLGNDAEARAEAEGVFQAAGDDAVDDADVDHVGQIVARRGLARGEADRAGIAADHGADVGRVHFFHFGVAAVGRRLRVAQHRIDLGAAQRLDAACRVDLIDRHGGAEATLLCRNTTARRTPDAARRLSQPCLVRAARPARAESPAAGRPSAVVCKNLRRLIVNDRRTMVTPPAEAGKPNIGSDGLLYYRHSISVACGA